MGTPLLVARVVGERLSVAVGVRHPDLVHSVTELQYAGPPTAGEVIRELMSRSPPATTCISWRSAAELPCWASATWPRLAHAAPATAAESSLPVPSARTG